ncbi:urease accessory protein UreD [Aureimonas psammosilenae]|uniref:urease accessory protein UreD n=1 Tax=Aureimonas psammosilenae TaxID=2495496 RepID=UPI001F1DE383|nr:urease accessory protein UreD [Aureimonas psammosilenae]
MSLAPGSVHAPVPMQRAFGRVAARVAVDDGAPPVTRLKRLHQAGCLKLRFPRLPDGRLEGVLINTSGGLTGGDRIEQSFEAADGAALTVTTQAAERIYRASSGDARVATSLRVGEGGHLAFLPQETILFDGGRLRRNLDIELAPGAGLLISESVILGRALMGEVVREGLFRDSWRVRRNGRLVFAEEARIEGSVEALASRRAALGEMRAFATILATIPEGGADLEAARDLVGDTGGASVVDGFLVVRLAAPSGFTLRKRLMPLLAALAKGPLPRVWSL